MIESIYIIEQSSGIPLFIMEFVERDEDSKPDNNLFSGFLKGIDDLVLEIRSERIEEIRMGSTRIVFIKEIVNDTALLFISISDLEDSLKIIKKILHKIANEFAQQFGEEAKAFKGNVTVFEPFSKTIQDIIDLEIGFKEIIVVKRHKHPISEFLSKLEPAGRGLGKIKEWLGKQGSKIKKYALQKK